RPSVEAERPYPLGALPDLIGKAVMEYGAYGQQPLPLIACSALSSVSLASQGLADVARDRDLVGPISLYFGVVAVSGERKTSADREFAKPLREWMMDRQHELRPEVDCARAKLAAWEAERDGVLNKIKSQAGKDLTGNNSELGKLKDRLAGLEGACPAQPM